MLVRFCCDKCGRAGLLWTVGDACGCGGHITSLAVQYRGPLFLRPEAGPKPLTTLDQEIAEIRARHERRREYNRAKNAADYRRRRLTHATPRDDLDESHD